MKKCFIAIVTVFIMLASCKKSTSPAAPAQPLGTMTVTQTITTTSTVTDTWTITETATLSATCSDTCTVTETCTPTNTPTIAFTELIPIQGGTFIETDISFAKSMTVTVSAYQIGKYEVTYELWHAVYQWALSNGYSFANAGKQGINGTIGAAPAAGGFEPVTTINWRDMIVWCNAYSQMSGIAPVYTSDPGFITPVKDSSDGAFGSSVNSTPGSSDNPYVNWSGTGYRLPTETEWEYAARYIDGSNWQPNNYASGAAGDTNNATATGSVAWYSGNSLYNTHNVGGLNPNAQFIYDMSGNVWETCWDWYDMFTPGTYADYRGAASGVGRVIHGGCYQDLAFLIVGFRSFGNTYDESQMMGFRIAATQ